MDQLQTEKILERSEFSKDLSPKVRSIATIAVADLLDRLAADEVPTQEEFLDIRGQLLGVVAFSKAVHRAITGAGLSQREET